MLVWPKFCITSLTNHTDLFLYIYIFYYKGGGDAAREEKRKRKSSQDSNARNGEETARGKRMTDIVSLL